MRPVLSPVGTRSHVKPLQARRYNCHLLEFCALLALGCHDISTPTASTPFPIPAEGMPSVQALPPFVDELPAYPSSALSLRTGFLKKS